MPHVILECSANVADHHDIDALIAVVHDTVVATEIAPTAGCRTRANVLEHYRIADGDPANAMIAITARLGLNTALLSLNLDRIAWQPCNPASGGSTT